MIHKPDGVTIAANWFCDYLLPTVTVVAIAALVLIGALALGWNTPRPGRLADWEAPELPRPVAVTSDAISIAMLDHPASDFVLELLASPLTGPESGFCDYGLVYRAQDPAHYYVFAIGADGYYTIGRMDGETMTPLVTWRQFPHIRRGQQPNGLVVTCSGSSCTFRINDEYAATVRDDKWLSGDLGLWVRSVEGDAAVQFRRVRLWALDS